MYLCNMEMTNNLRKLIGALTQRKYRREYGLFKAEGTKCVVDTIKSFRLYTLVTTRRWADEHSELTAECSEHLVIVPARDIERLSSLTTPQEVIAIYHIPEYSFDPFKGCNELIIALDSVQDPGNLGTIMRTADWFGITNIICSRNTADVYNPKVVQATMGAISRVRVNYVELCEVLSILAARMPVYGTFLDGEPIYKANLSANGVIVMGNEGSGISAEIARYAKNRLLIPSFSRGATSESLNVATATAITVSEFRRRFN